MPTPTNKAALALVLLAATCLATAAMAQSPAPQRAPGGASITVPLQDMPMSQSLGERAERMWSGMLGQLGLNSGANSVMRSASDTARRQARARDDFAWLMDVAGYKLKEIESSVSLIPGLSLTFGQARELTEADRDHVERQLERHARRNPGAFEAMQRAIVRGVLEASEIGGFTVDKVEIDLFPWPKVKLILVPTDAPVGIDAARILRSIERLNQRLQDRQTRTGYPDLPFPPAGVNPLLQPAVLPNTRS